jgi:hypothetical protein
VSATVKVARVARTSSLLPPRPAGSAPPPRATRSTPPPLPKVAPPPRRPSFEAREDARVEARAAICDAIAAVQGVMENLRAKLVELDATPPPEPTARASTPPPLPSRPPPPVASRPPPAASQPTPAPSQPPVAPPSVIAAPIVPRANISGTSDVDVPFRDPHRRAKVLGVIALAIALVALFFIGRMG